MSETHMQCPKCRREFAINRDGAIRRHWCEAVTGDSRAIEMSSGGTLTVQLHANWMLFDEQERGLLNAIIDLLDAYEDERLARIGKRMEDVGLIPPEAEAPQEEQR